MLKLFVLSIGLAQTPAPEVLNGDDVDGVESGDLLRPAQMGNLQRVVASLESTLEVYRLALAEIELAGALIAELGSETGAKPDRALPENAREVFGRLARVLSSRVPADALAPIPRGYHFEALDALEKLAAAKQLGEVREPLGIFVRGVERVAGVADEVVDLFSRRRPIQVQIFDADTALAQISDAIEAVSVAERRILALRKRGAGLNEQFQAFLFLEISLGNALDLIAAAEEAGINVGFELQLALEGFRASLQRVRERAAALRASYERMIEPPGVRAASALVWSVEGLSQDPMVEIELKRRGRGEFAAWRVEAFPLLEPFKQDVVRQARCEGLNETDALERAEKAMLDYPADAVLIANVDPKLDAFSVPRPKSELPLGIRIRPVSAFGELGEPLEVELLRIPATAQPPLVLNASVKGSGPFDSEFYYDFDEVVLDFDPSPNDLDRTLAGKVSGVPRVSGYSVYRGEEFVTRLDPGQTVYSDRVAAQWLSSGVAYSLVTHLDSGADLTTPKCAAYDEVQADRERELVLAEAGAEFLSRPSMIEREVETRLRGDLVKREQLREKLSAAENRIELLDRWWASLEKRQRESLLARWVELNGGEDSEWFKRVVEPSARDRDWVLAAMWLEEQEPVVRREVSRLWKLLHPSVRAQEERRWFEARDARWREELAAQLRDADEVVRSGILEPARIAFWVGEKDLQERQLLYDWWEELSSEAREQRLRTWLDSQPRGLVRELRWPGQDALTEEEKQVRMETAHRDLPAELEPEFFAWWRFEQLEGDELRQAIAADVGAVNVLRARLHYGARPLDRATGFNALILYIFALIATPVLVWFWRGRKRTVRRIVAPPV